MPETRERGDRAGEGTALRPHDEGDEATIMTKKRRGPSPICPNCGSIIVRRAGKGTGVCLEQGCGHVGPWMNFVRTCGAMTRPEGLDDGALDGGRSDRGRGPDRDDPVDSTIRTPNPRKDVA